MTGEVEVLLCDPRIAIAVADAGEPLVDLRELPELWLDQRQADAAGAFARLREGVVQRLLDAQRAVFDGYRGQLRGRHPDWSAERLYVETSKFASPVHLAPHGTGGAIDLTLCTAEAIHRYSWSTR